MFAVFPMTFLGHHTTVWNFLQFVFIECPSRGQPKCIKAFSKNKKRLEPVSLSHFLHDFSKTIFLTLYSTKWSNFIASLPLLLDYIVQLRYYNSLFPACDVINLEVNLSFLIKSEVIKFSSTWPKSQDKNLNILRTKRAFKKK